MLIFGTGVVTGGLLVRNSTRMQPHQPKNTSIARPSQPFPPFSANGIKIEFLRRMERDLNLSTEQRERIDGILTESQERTRKLMEPVAPQLREELQQTKERFRAALTPPQREAFDAMLKQQQRPRDQRHPGGHGTEGGSLQAPSGDPVRNP
jgi:hypothetical protein